MDKKLRIAHYNIFSGGGERLDKIKEVITLMSPDVCCVLEAAGWEENLSFYEAYCKQMGFSYFYFSKANSRHNIAVFSKLQLIVSSVTESIKHVIVKAVIDEGDQKGTALFFLHLSPVSEDARLLEVAALLNSIDHKIPTLVLGDFNSLSPFDQYKKESLLHSFKQKNITKYGTDVLRFDVIPKMESSGFVDVFRYLKKGFEYSVPTAMNTDPNHEMKLRIDYVFANDCVLDQIISTDFEKGTLTDSASDHYPLWVDIANKK